MPYKRENVYAFIDSQNLYLGVKEQGWLLDYRKFRKYLSAKYRVSRAFLFLGYLPQNRKLYEKLRDFGYELIFKPVQHIKPGGVVKGNVDAELVLEAALHIDEYSSAVVVTGDGDFRCLLVALKKRGKLLRLIIPNQNHFSSMLRRFRAQIVFLDKIRGKVEKE